MISLRPRPRQLEIIERTSSLLRDTGHAVVLLHGNTGSGKSIIGPLLAVSLKAKFCNSLKPWQPGDRLGHLCSEADPTQDNPLVVVFDEIDIVLQRVLEGMPANMKMPTVITDKPSWNTFFDEMQWRLYPHVVIIMTTNKSFAELEALDSSLVRCGRIDMVFEV
jgi:ATP-dependent 26S proteasome regulatory subunit